MDSLGVKSIIRKDSLEEFEFVDIHGDLNVDLSESPIHEGRTFFTDMYGAVADKAGSGFFSIISALSSVAENQGLVVRISPRAMAATAVGGITGSLLGGPPGLAIGLVTGAVLGYRSSSRKAKTPEPEKETSSIRQIFNQMTLQQKKELLKELLGCLKHSSVRSLMLEVAKNENVRNMAFEVLSTFLMKKMGASLTRPK